MGCHIPILDPEQNQIFCCASNARTKGYDHSEQEPGVRLRIQRTNNEIPLLKPRLLSTMEPSQTEYKEIDVGCLLGKVGHLVEGILFCWAL